MNIVSLLKGEISQSELLNYYNANITYEILPNEIDGFIFSYRGINNIIINANLSYYRRKKTIIHELAHIELNHLYQKDNDLLEFKRCKYEDEADKYLKFIYNNLIV